MVATILQLPLHILCALSTEPMTEQCATTMMCTQVRFCVWHATLLLTSRCLSTYCTGISVHNFAHFITKCVSYSCDRSPMSQGACAREGTAVINTDKIASGCTLY